VCFADRFATAQNRAPLFRKIRSLPVGIFSPRIFGIKERDRGFVTTFLGELLGERERPAHGAACSGNAGKAKLEVPSSKGGKSVPDEKRSFSQDPELASEAGRKGGVRFRRKADPLARSGKGR
jgi:general stress protein YciG